MADTVRVGDRILVEVAQRLRRALSGKEDIAGRMGGDEFTVILSSPPTQESAFEAARQILHSLRAPYLVDGQELADYLDSISDLAPAEPVDPGYARKLLHDLVSWARTVGFAPHRDYLKLEPIFGSVAAASRR